MVQASARSREAPMEETTTAREATPATDGTASFGLSSGTAVIGAANPDGAPVVPSLLPGTAQQMLAEVETGVITYVLDTSVLLSDPLSLHRFAEHDIVLPIVVITELEAKRHHPDLGYFARQALRILDDLRERHGNLSRPLPIGKDGGHAHVELNHMSTASLPDGFRPGDNDTPSLAVAKNHQLEGKNVVLVSKDRPMRIKASASGVHADLNHLSTASLPGGFRLGDNDTRVLGVANNLQLEGKNVVLVSKDLPMRIKASASGVHAEEYRAEPARDRRYTGMVTASVDE